LRRPGAGGYAFAIPPARYIIAHINPALRSRPRKPTYYAADQPAKLDKLRSGSVVFFRAHDHFGRRSAPEDISFSTQQIHSMSGDHAIYKGIGAFTISGYLANSDNPFFLQPEHDVRKHPFKVGGFRITGSSDVRSELINAQIGAHDAAFKQVAEYRRHYRTLSLEIIGPRSRSIF
jgi:hypothetical protein